MSEKLCETCGKKFDYIRDNKHCTSCLEDALDIFSATVERAKLKMLSDPAGPMVLDIGSFYVGIKQAMRVHHLAKPSQ